MVDCNLSVLELSRTAPVILFFYLDSFVGGGYSEGYSVLDTAVKEIQEEAGLVVTNDLRNSCIFVCLLFNYGKPEQNIKC